MLERTRSTWERCYERTPAEPAELALQLIGFDLDERLPDQACEFCDGEVVQPAVGRERRFCSERCRRDASMARTGVPVPRRSTLAA